VDVCFSMHAYTLMHTHTFTHMHTQMNTFDPSSPEFKAHARFWQWVCDVHTHTHTHRPLTMTPEYGPFPYCVNEGGVGVGVDDLNRQMGRWLRERFDGGGGEVQ
jgi:hypothetical protein